MYPKKLMKNWIPVFFFSHFQICRFIHTCASSALSNTWGSKRAGCPSLTSLTLIKEVEMKIHFRYNNLPHKTKLTHTIWNRNIDPYKLFCNPESFDQDGSNLFKSKHIFSLLRKNSDCENHRSVPKPQIGSKVQEYNIFHS